MEKYDFGLLEGGRVVDLRPMGQGNAALMWNGSCWESYTGYVGTLLDARPLTEATAMRLLGVAPVGA
ncbi:MAG: hypothetical protein OEY97_12380 [Nitrospirota bacterium]|nr:hypothetical protein [Nitrospirota bacterium]